MDEVLLVDDAARDAAVERLSDAHAVGRLTRPEFESRVADALSARTDRDLGAVLRGLPQPTPLVAAVHRPARLAWLRRPGAVIGLGCTVIGLSLLGYVGVAIVTYDEPGDPPVIACPALPPGTPDRNC